MFAFRLMWNANFFPRMILFLNLIITQWSLRSRLRCRSQARSLLPEDTAVYRLQHYCPFRADSSGEPRCLVRVSLNVEREFFSADDIISKPHHNAVEPAPRSYGALFLYPKLFTKCLHFQPHISPHSSVNVYENAQKCFRPA